VGPIDEDRVMKKKWWLLFAIWMPACGGKVLDIGGPSGSGGSGGGGDTGSWPITGQRNARALKSIGPHLYWIADDSTQHVLRRCEKTRCSSTVTAIARPRYEHLMGFEIVGETLYLVTPGSIVHCPLADCRETRQLVFGIQPLAVAFDDSNVYWAQPTPGSTRYLENRIFQCALSGCKEPVPTPFAGTRITDLLVDEERLYWISGTSDVAQEISSGKKAETAPVTVLAARQNQVASFALHGGFVYWTTSMIVGAVARCPVTGCGADGPEVLIDRQSYPHFVVPTNEGLTWMNGPRASGSLGLPIEIRSCLWPDCSSTITVLDQGTGSGYGVRASSNISGVDMGLPPREMAVDDEAIYWFGDVVDLAPGNPDLPDEVAASLRRTEKSPRP
jgi:hypothetical protein